MPNLFSDLPVEILWCVRASTSGLTLSAMRAVAPFWRAIAEIARNSGSDSTLKHRMSSSSAWAISAAVLPTPEKVMRDPGTPAARARRNSPSDTTSMPAPSRARVLSTA